MSWRALVAAWVCVTPALAAGAEDTAARVSAHDIVADGDRAEDGPPVQDLPRFVEAPLPAASSLDLARLDGLIDQLVSKEAQVRLEALRAARQVDPSWLPAISERLNRLAHRANKPALQVSLERIREQAREQQKGAMKREGKTGPVVTPDYLDMLVNHPDRSSAVLRPLTEVVAYSRMLESIATLAAARGVVSIYVRFGEFLRGDTQLALARMKDASIAALIEATAHPVPHIAEWATKQLEDMGKAVASEAVQVTDPVHRADILRAYGKNRDLGTARLLISFGASERASIRLAAREAVALLGEPGLWQLRDAYEKAVGERAPKEWPWERVARELFAQYDRQRLEPMYALYRQGRQAEQRGDLDGALAAFDQVLAWDPTFERGARMAGAYFAFAEARATRDPDAAILALRRAERLDPSGPVQARAQSLRHTLEAKALLERGIVDDVLLRRARELDPENHLAEALLGEIEADAAQGRAAWRGYVAAGVIAALAAIVLLVMTVRQRRADKASAGAAL